MKPEGYEKHHDGKCYTIFSAPNYCDTIGNQGAFITITGDNLFPPRIQSFDSVIFCFGARKKFLFRFHILTLKPWRMQATSSAVSFRRKMSSKRFKKINNFLEFYVACISVVVFHLNFIFFKNGCYLAHIRSQLC